MASSQSKSKSSETVIERPDINWRETSPEGSLILSVMKEAVKLAPIGELKNAACWALLIFKSTQIVKENKKAYERLAYDSSGLIVAIWRSFKEAVDQEEWLSAEMRAILEDLSNTLKNICSFVDEQLSKRKVIRVIFSRADGAKIKKYSEHLNYAMQKFELQSHMNINDVLIRILKKDDQISEQILHRNEEEMHVLAREAGDRKMAEKLQEEFYSEDSEKRAQENTDREIAEKFQEGDSEGKRTLENIAREAQDREIPKPEQLKQFEMPVNSQTEVEQWRSDELTKIEKETKDRNSNSELERLRVLAARELEEANRSMKAAEEEIAQLKQALAAKEDNQRSNEIQARSSEKKSSRHWQEDEELEGNFIENLKEASSKKEEERPSPASPPSPRKSPKVECKPQTSSAWGTLPRNVDSDDSTAQFRGGLGRSESSSRSGPYGYDDGMPQSPVVTAGGSILNSIISNVGNNNSVLKKIYRPRNQRRRGAKN